MHSAHGGAAKRKRWTKGGLSSGLTRQSCGSSCACAWAWRLKGRTRERESTCMQKKQNYHRRAFERNPDCQRTALHKTSFGVNAAAGQTRGKWWLNTRLTQSRADLYHGGLLKPMPDYKGQRQIVKLPNGEPHRTSVSVLRIQKEAKRRLITFHYI